MNNIKKYETPDFDVTVYEVEDVLTASSTYNLEIGKNAPNYGIGWFG